VVVTRSTTRPERIGVVFDGSVSDSHVCQGRSMRAGDWLTPAQAESLGHALLTAAMGSDANGGNESP